MMQASLLLRYYASSQVLRQHVLGPGIVRVQWVIWAVQLRLVTGLEDVEGKLREV